MGLSAGVRLGHFEIVGSLGAGGMGEVYRARDVRLDRVVALKVLPPAFAADRDRLERFTREARLASNLNHPNIVTVHDIGEAGGVRFIAMELVEGQTLADYMSAGSDDLGTIVDLAAQISEALAASHAAGVAHRDLKPSNVMITGDRRAKLLDFGLGRESARVPGSTAETLAGRNDTAAGMMLGTAAYMSPEQARGERGDFRSDQFAFGILLYQWLAKRHPFARASTVETMSAIIGAPAPPLVVYNRHVPEVLALIVERCLAKRPDERFASTADLAREVRDVAEHVRSGRRLALVPARVRVRPAVAATAVLVGVLAALLAWLWQGTPTVAPTSRTIAVLPFTNVGRDAETQLMTEGLVELLTTRLTQLERPGGSLWVVPATEVRQQQVVSARDARKAFSADLAISGSVQRTAEQYFITLNVSDAGTLRQIGAATISTSIVQAATLQQKVVDEIVTLLGVPVGAAQRHVLEAGRTSAPGAYEYYLQGRGYLGRPGADSLDSALQLLERAIAIDPSYGLAHAALAETAWRKFEGTRDTAWVQRARASADRALAAEPGLTQVRVTQAIIAAGTGQYETAVEILRGVLIDDPANADAYRELARAYDGLGDVTAAEAAFRQALSARPGDWLAYNALGAFLVRQRRPADAVPLFERVVALTPDNARGYSNLGSTLALLGRDDEAIAALTKAAALGPTASILSNIGTIYYRRGRYQEAVAAFEQASLAGPSSHLVWFNLASAYSRVPGTAAKSRAAYERALELGEKERAVNGRQAALIARLAISHAALGHARDARAAIAESERLAPSDPQILLNAAEVHDTLGDRPAALRRLQAAFAAGATDQDVASRRSLDALRADPAYSRLRPRS